MSEDPSNTNRVVTIIQTPLPIASATALDVDTVTQSHDLTFDGLGQQEKNPFSSFSEEHLSRLDDFLSTEEAQKILQQTTVVDTFNNTQTQGQRSTLTEADTDAPDDRPEDLLDIFDDKSDQPELGSPFSDHAYAIPLKRTTRSSLQATPPTAQMSSPRKRGQTKDEVMIVSDVGNDVEISQEETKTGKGRGRGRKSQGEVPLGSSNNRRSSRISDNEQREMAEKIRQENLQKEKEAMEAVETKEEEESPKKKTRGRPKKVEEDSEDKEKQVGKRGRSKAGTQDEESGSESEGEEKEENKNTKRGRPKKGKAKDDESEEESENETSKSTKGKKGRPKKGKDSESEEEDTPKGKGRKGRSKSKTKKGDEGEDEKGKKSAGKKKGKNVEDSESESETESPKKTKGRRGRPKKVKGEESESEAESPVKGKGKKGRLKKGKQEDSEGESEVETPKKGGKGKGKARQEESEPEGTPKKGKGQEDESENNAKNKKGKKGVKNVKDVEESPDEGVEEATHKRGGKGKYKKTADEEENAEDLEEINKNKHEKESESSDDNEPLSTIKSESKEQDKITVKKDKNIFDALISVKNSEPEKDTSVGDVENDKTEDENGEKVLESLKSVNTDRKSEEFNDPTMTELFKPDSVIPTEEEHQQEPKPREHAVKHSHDADSNVQGDENVLSNDHEQNKTEIVVHAELSDIENEEKGNTDLISIENVDQGDNNPEKIETKTEVKDEIDNKKNEDNIEVSKNGTGDNETTKLNSKDDFSDSDKVSGAKTQENDSQDALVVQNVDENSKIKEMYKSSAEIKAPAETNLSTVAVMVTSEDDEPIEFEATIENVDFASISNDQPLNASLSDDPTLTDASSSAVSHNLSIFEKLTNPQSEKTEKLTQSMTATNSVNTKSLQTDKEIEKKIEDSVTEKKKPLGRKGKKVIEAKSSSDLDTSDITGSELEEDSRVLRRKRARNPLVEEFLKKETRKRKKSMKSEDEGAEKETEKQTKGKKKTKEEEEPKVKKGKKEKKEEKEEVDDDEEEEEEEESESDLDSEEEYEPPDQKYCICNKPYGNKFMICCDRCENWYHGKCIGITRARGKEMDENKEEYICDACKEKEKIDKIKGKTGTQSNVSNPMIVKMPGLSKSPKEKKKGLVAKKDEKKEIVKGNQKTTLKLKSGDVSPVKILKKVKDEKNGSKPVEKSEKLTPGKLNKSGKTEKVGTIGKSEKNVTTPGKQEKSSNTEKNVSMIGRTDKNVSTIGKTDKNVSIIGKTDKNVSTIVKTDKKSGIPGKVEKVASTQSKTDKNLSTSGKQEKNSNINKEKMTSGNGKSDKNSSSNGKSDKNSGSNGKSDKSSSTAGKANNISSTSDKSASTSIKVENNSNNGVKSDKITSSPAKSDKMSNTPSKSEKGKLSKSDKVLNTLAKSDGHPEIFSPDKVKIMARKPSVEQKQTEPKLPRCIGPKCGKVSRPDSVYCSNECIINHSQDSLNIIHSQQDSVIKLTGDKRIVVIEKTTGKILTGDKAPTEAELCAWLEKNPSYSVLCPTMKKLKVTDKDQKPKESTSSHHEHHHHHGDKDHHRDRKESSSERKSDSSKDRKGQHSESSKDKKSHSSHRKHEHKHSSHKHSSSGKKDQKNEKSDKSETKIEDAGPDPVRLNVRKSLRDALASRAEKADDVLLSMSEIKSLALEIENELYGYFKETGHKYKAKYRSLIFNIKDSKNKGLFRKILNGDLKPEKLIKMTPEELASRELAKWREFETKHELDMIVQAEEEIQKEGLHFVKKTHKGEIELDIEKEEEDLSTLEDHGVEKPKQKASESEKPSVDFVGGLIDDTTSQHKKHLFDLNCRICTGKETPPPVVDTTPKKVRVARTVRIEEPGSSSDKDKLKPVEEKKKEEEVVKEVLKAIHKAKKEQMEEARKMEEAKKKEEQTAKEQMTEEGVADSTVTVRSPDSALQSGLEQKPDFTPKGPQVWKGFVSMQDVAKFVTTAYQISGPQDKLNIPDTIHVCGRISPEQVFDYLAKMRKIGTKDIIVLRFIPGPNEEKTSYINLYSYLNSRSRCGVVGSVSKYIKDFYILPLASHSKIPSVIKPFVEQGLERNRPHMLLALIVRQKLKPHGVEPSSKQKLKHDQVQKVKGHEKRSYTPPGQKSYGPPSKVPKIEKKEEVEEYDPERPTVDSKPYDPSQNVVFKKPAPVKRPSPSSSPGTSSIKPLKGAASLVSQMMEKLKVSTNATEANEYITEGLTPMATITDKQKLLLELTQRVCEQKKLIELKHAGKSVQESNLPLVAVANAMTAISQISKTLVSAPKRAAISASQLIAKSVESSTSSNEATNMGLTTNSVSTSLSSETNLSASVETKTTTGVISTTTPSELSSTGTKTLGLLPHEVAAQTEKMSTMPEALKSLFSSIPGSYSHVTKYEEAVLVKPETEEKEKEVVMPTENIIEEEVSSNQIPTSSSETLIQTSTSESFIPTSASERLPQTSASQTSEQTSTPETSVQTSVPETYLQTSEPQDVDMRIKPKLEQNKKPEKPEETKNKFNVSLLDFDYGDSDSENEELSATPSGGADETDTRPSSVMSSSSEESQDSANIAPLQYPPLPDEPAVPPPLPDEPPPPPPDHAPEEEEVSDDDGDGKKGKKKKKKKKKGKKDRPAPEIVLEAKDPISKAILDASFRRLMEKQNESMVVPPMSPVVVPPMSTVVPNVSNVPITGQVGGTPFQSPAVAGMIQTMTNVPMANTKPALLPTPPMTTVIMPQANTMGMPQANSMGMPQANTMAMPQATTMGMPQNVPMTQPPQPVMMKSIPSLFDVEAKPSKSLILQKMEGEPGNELDRELCDLADADWRTEEPVPQDLDMRQDQDLRMMDVDMRQPVNKPMNVQPNVWPEDVDHRKGGRFTPDPVFGSDLQLPTEDSDLRNFCSPLDQDYRRRDMPPKDVSKDNVLDSNEDQDFRVGQNKHGHRRGSHDRDRGSDSRRRRHEDYSHRKSKRRRRDDDRHHSRHDDDRDHRHRDRDHRRSDRDHDPSVPQDIDQRQSMEKKIPPPPRLADKVPVPPPQVLAQKAATDGKPPGPPPLQPPPLPPGIDVRPFTPTPPTPRRSQPPPPGIDDW